MDSIILLIFNCPRSFRVSLTSEFCPLWTETGCPGPDLIIGGRRQPSGSVRQYTRLTKNNVNDKSLI